MRHMGQRFQKQFPTLLDTYHPHLHKFVSTQVQSSSLFFPDLSSRLSSLEANFPCLCPPTFDSTLRNSDRRNIKRNAACNGAR